MAKVSDKQITQTLQRGLQLLEFIADGNSGSSVRQLAKEIKLPFTIVHRLLSTLQASGYLQKNSPLPGYRLTTKLWTLGFAAIQNLEVKQVARSHLDALALKSKELVNICIIDGREVLYLDKVDCSQAVRAHIPVGGRAPAYAVATGKAILAYLGDDELVKIIPSMEKFTKTTVVGQEALRKQLASIRKRGFSINRGEFREEIGGVAASVRDREGIVIAAVGITAPLSRLTRETVFRFGRLTMETALSISAELGHRPGMTTNRNAGHGLPIATYSIAARK